MYVTLPIYKGDIDTSQRTANIFWLGIKYWRRISNNISQVEKDDQWKKFIRDCQYDLFKKNVNDFIYLEKVGNTRDYDIYNAAIKNSPKGNDGNNIVLLPINKPFEARNGYKLPWVFGSLAIGLFLFFIILRPIKLDEVDLTNYKNGKNKIY